MTDSESSNSDKGFKVNDRRGRGPDSEEKTSASDHHVTINFASFILSLSTSALMHMGHTESPTTNEKEVDLHMAKQEIGLIEMLKEKTAGNLSDEEKTLIEDALYHLRLKYVALTKQA